MGRYVFFDLKNKDEFIVVDERDLKFYFKIENECDYLVLDNQKIKDTKEIQLSEDNIAEYFVLKYDDIIGSSDGRVVYIQIKGEDSIRKDFFFTFTTSDHIQSMSDSSDIKQKIIGENTKGYLIHDPMKVYK